MTKIRWAIGTTINIGDFSNLKFEFEVIDDVKDGESIDEAQNRIYNYVEDKIQEKIDETRDELAASVRQLTSDAKAVR